MKRMLLTKKVLANADMTVDNAAFTTTAVDCEGYRYAVVDFIFGNVPADVAAMNVQNSDLSNMGSADTLVNFASGTDIDGAALALPTASGGDGKIWSAEIDLLGKKRYLDGNVTAGNGSNTATECAVLVTLHNGEIGKLTAASRGCAQIARA